MITAGTRDLSRQANISLVIGAIREHRLISRSDIAGLLGLKRSTVTTIVQKLMELDLVRTHSMGDSTAVGGRKPVLLEINPRRVYVLGMEVQAGFCRAVVVDLLGNPVDRLVIPADTTGGNVRFAETFIALYRQIRERMGPASTPVYALGVGIPGPVDGSRNVIVESRSLHLQDFEYHQSIAVELEIPALFENDANCCVLGEHWSAPAEELNNSIFLLSRLEVDPPGIGLGIMIDGEIYYGHRYRAGEYQIVPQELAARIGVIVQALDPKCLILGGDSTEMLLPVLTEALECPVLPGSSGDFEIAFGAATMVLSRLYSPPRIGRDPQNLDFTWEQIFSRLENPSP